MWKSLNYLRLKTVLVILLIFLSACTTGKSQACGEKNQAWVSNLALWRSKTVSDYDMVIERFRNPMYGHVPFLIKVRNGENVALEPARENKGLEKTDGYEAVATVEKMFTTIKQACERGDTITVEYDPELGVPKLFGFSNLSHGTDSGDGYKLTKLVPIGE